MTDNAQETHIERHIRRRIPHTASMAHQKPGHGLRGLLSERRLTETSEGPSAAIAMVDFTLKEGTSDGRASASSAGYRMPAFDYPP